MTQNPKMLALGLVGGYLLGRTRKAKFALTVASVVLGKRMGVNPQQLLTEGLKKLSSTPEFSRLEEQIRGELMSAGKSMVTAAANRRMDSLSDALRDRTESLSGLEEDKGEPEGEEPEGGEPEERAEEEPQEEPTTAKTPQKKAPSKKAPPEKAPAAKAEPQKAAAKKSTAEKTASRQPAAKKTTARGTAANKAASRSTGRR